MNIYIEKRRPLEENITKSSNFSSKKILYFVSNSVKCIDCRMTYNMSTCLYRSGLYRSLVGS